MGSWRIEALKKLEDSWGGGSNPDEIVRDVLEEFRPFIMLDAEVSLLNRFRTQRKDEWAEPPLPLPQLRFDFDGTEFAISDAPVLYLDEESETRFKPARYSTGVEREASIEARIVHHQSWIQRSEAEHRRETEQNSIAAKLGISLLDTPWDAVRHKDTKCWRCGGGYRAWDPFERGHVDAPESQGGLVVAWEHRECNRSAQDNPVTEPFEDEE